MLRRFPFAFPPTRLDMLRIAFALCLIFVFFALGWTSANMLRLENSRRDASLTAARERDFSAAAAEADARVGHWIASENSRPYFDYLAFRAESRPHEALFAPPIPGEPLAPSPFLATSQPLARLHFMVSPAGALTSPEYPSGDLRAATAPQSKPTGRQLAAAALLNALRERHKREDFRSVFSQATARQIRRQSLLPGGAFPRNMPRPNPNDDPDDNANAANNAAANNAAAANATDPEKHSPTTSATPTTSAPAAPPAPLVHADNDALFWARFSGEMSPLAPVWLDGELYLLRSVATTQGDCVQGIWLNWPALRSVLAEGAAKRLPGADFAPRPPNFSPQPGRVPLDSLPEIIFTAETTVGSPEEPVASLRVTLVLCWIFAALAMLGVGGLFFGVISLSERRASFVSVVTHELRTPLTTFQLYTEMLEDDMVPEESRKTYLATLRAEASRLTHLVENVLGFARLERGRSLRRDEILSAGEIMERVAPRLRERLAAAEITFETSLSPADSEVLTRTDGTSVEQILFNLADNAAKYAGGAGRSAKLTARVETGALCFEFSDDGGGIPQSALRKLFQPFHRSTEEATGRKPGVGLGLAFSRQLARRLGGDLKLLRNSPSGAVFLLRLPTLAE
ncbi:MAG: HAMP domain-containing histidine kinase [Puniceicoccales bacterium]|jgi:signal transduction histidine kinase|nr:HAMP domain-containing histidine kinase [Puniceicoccales bacterium]